MLRRRAVPVFVTVLVAVAWSLSMTPGIVGASPPDGEEVDEIEVSTQGGDTSVESGERPPLIEVPPGCALAELPYVVFEGRVLDRDNRTARFEVVNIRVGEVSDFAIADLIDIRYGLDVQYLDDGENYLVGAALEPSLGLLYSRVSDPAPDFGGDQIVGLAEPDVDCPVIADPIRTLQPDGAPVETSVLRPLTQARSQVFWALVLPLLIASGVLFVIATFRIGVTEVLRAARTALRRR